MSKFNFVLLIVFILSLATFFVALYLDNEKADQTEQLEAQTEESVDVRQP